MISVRLYSRPGCHLCEEMKSVLERVTRSAGLPIALTEVNISSSPDLEARYGLEIPVLEINGRKAAKYRVTEDALLRALRASTSP